MLRQKRIFFNDRQGQTVLSPVEKKGLKLTHISNMKELDEAEQMNINEGLLWLQGQKSEDYISEDFFQKLHLKLFGKVWRWAGVYRHTNKNIGIDYWKVPREMNGFVENANYWLKNKSYPDWPEFLAHFHHKLVFIHPFPNGNGRFSRIVTNHLCKMNQHEAPTWQAHLEPKVRRGHYIKSLREADDKQYSKLIDFFKREL